MSSSSFAEELGVDPQELSLFQQNILLTLAEADEGLYGLRIKRELEDLYGEEINHGRLYPNLDELWDRGLIAKVRRDMRTNDYSLTVPGRELLTKDAQRRAQILELPAPRRRRS